MQQGPASHSTDSERAELESVLEALVRTPRLAKLLQFLGERSLQGKTDEITEYNIATEVFGRSKVSFDGSRDSIARVETHRLRKRLKEYYGTEGKDHEILISLPFRSYVPEFNRRTASPSALTTLRPAENTLGLEALSPESFSETAETHALVQLEATETSPTVSRAPRNRRLVYSAAATAALLVVAFGVILTFNRSRSANSADAVTGHLSDTGQSVTPSNAAQVPLRILAGYEGSPRIDSAGEYWQADHYFEGGGAFRRPDAQVSRTSDPMLFEHWRTGDFSYNIPLAPGPYELHLFFVASPPDEFKTQFFDVRANEKLILPSFNISADALGVDVADEKVFKDIYPDSDGYLHLKFSMVRSAPLLNALEILPGLPHRQLPVRLVMQPAAVRDHNGNVWHPDTYFQNGTVSDPPREVGGTADPNLYSRERYGHFTYSIPVDTSGRYTLVLYFAELYWGPQAAGTGGVGSRIFRVYCNGQTLLDNFDIFKEAGSLRAVTKTFYHLRPSPEGKLDLTFDPIVNYGTISAIEVIDESQ